MGSQSSSLGVRKRRLFYDLFSKNLLLTKQLFKARYPEIRFEPDIDDGYVCPLCFTVFPPQALLNSYANPLQLEHVPPGKLGGKERLLTCKRCNNTDGSQLENHLKQKLHEYEFVEGFPGSGIDIRFRVENEINLAATMYHTDPNNFKIVYDPNPKRSHPQHVENWRSVMARKNIPPFSIQIRDSYKPHSAEVALLRIAYLWAFSVFGYEFLFFPNLEPVRQQILQPSKRILPVLGITSTTLFSDDALGINVIFEPEELQSLLVVFDLVTSNRTSRHGVLLPGPTEPSLSIYTWLAENMMLPAEIRANPVPEHDYLQRSEFDYLSVWSFLRSGPFQS